MEEALEHLCLKKFLWTGGIKNLMSQYIVRITTTIIDITMISLRLANSSSIATILIASWHVATLGNYYVIISLMLQTE